MRRKSRSRSSRAAGTSEMVCTKTERKNDKQRLDRRHRHPLGDQVCAEFQKAYDRPTEQQKKRVRGVFRLTIQSICLAHQEDRNPGLADVQGVLANAESGDVR